MRQLDLLTDYPPGKHKPPPTSSSQPETSPNTPLDLLQDDITYHEIESHLEKYLAEEVARFTLPDIKPIIDSDANSKWRFSSASQKCLRRGLTEDATRFALAYNAVDSAGFWQRLPIVGFEDIGIANPAGLALVLAAARSKPLRQRIGGDALIIPYLIKTLCEGNKDRTTTDFMIHLWSAPLKPREYSLLKKATLQELQEIALYERNTSIIRTAALWLLWGSDKHENKNLPLRRGSREMFTETIEKMKLSSIIRYIVLRGLIGCSRYPYSIVYPSIWQMWEKSAYSGVVKASLPEYDYIGGLPDFTYDMYTREGKASFGYFLKACAPVREWLSGKGLVGIEEAKAAVGAATFICEGGQLGKKLDFEGAAEIYHKTEGHDYRKAGLSLEDGRELARLIQENHAVLRQARQVVVEGNHR
ncbi:MAG TPA: hypothetical protein VI298_06135 [Geobacteraceae bacterium]